MTKKFTVLLQRPDWADCETYMTCVTAANPVEALAVARAEVCAADDDPFDHACLLVIAGDHKDLNPEL